MGQSLKRRGQAGVRTRAMQTAPRRPVPGGFLTRILNKKRFLRTPVKRLMLFF
jgi:hypothetical protein